MSWFSKNCWERSALQQNLDGQTRRMRKKNRIKRKKTIFCQFVFVSLWELFLFNLLFTSN